LRAFFLQAFCITAILLQDTADALHAKDRKCCIVVDFEWRQKTESCQSMKAARFGMGVDSTAAKL